MSNFRASDNHVNNSSYTNFTHTTNVFGSVQADDLQAWMRDQAAQSGALCVPGVFAPRLTESIVQSSGFRACMSHQSACMLLKGSMGAGKTTAICKLIQELRKEHMIIVFILFDTSRALQQDPSRVLMHFVRQLVDLNDHDQRILISGLQQRSSFDRPSADEVVDIFVALIARRTQESKEALCILLDGLDQFKNRDDLDTLLRHVANIQRRTRCGVTATSRFEEICFHSIFKNHFDVQICATYEDTEHIVRSYSPSHHVDDLIVRDASLINMISRTVMDGSRALFELVMSNTAYIMRTNTDREFYKALETVSSMTRQPGEIHKNLCGPAFDKRIESLMSRCNDSDDRDTRNQDLKDMVTFVRDACRPLLAVELLHMLALRRGASDFGQMDLQNAEVISDVTQGLVNIDRNGVVQFSHPALRAHLRLNPRWLLQFPDANFVLAELCLNYLSLHLPDEADDTEADFFSLTSDSPFLIYSGRNWHVHYATAMKNSRNADRKSLQTSAMQFLRSKASFSHGVQLMQLPDPVHEDLAHPDSYRFARNNPKGRLNLDQQVAAQDIEGTTGMQLAIMLKIDDLIEALADELSWNMVHPGLIEDAVSTHPTIPHDSGHSDNPLGRFAAEEKNVTMQSDSGAIGGGSSPGEEVVALPFEDNKALMLDERDYEGAILSATAAAFASVAALTHAEAIRTNSKTSNLNHSKNDQQKDRKDSSEQANHRGPDHVARGGGAESASALEAPPVGESKIRFVAVETLGQGAFGKVEKVKQSGGTSDEPEYFARKFMFAPRASENSSVRRKLKELAMNEVAVMRKLQHHHIASVLCHIEEPDGFSLIMPTVADFDLLLFLDSCIGNDFPKDQTALLDPWFGCLVTALKFAHANKVKHDDLKPSNILIKDNRVYIADFGCATKFEITSSPQERIAGTPVYRPPEPGTPGRLGDVFALGCVFSEMLTVRQGRTLADYQAARKVDEIDNPYAYRKNLAQVHHWLATLPNINRGTPNVLLEMIPVMLEKDPDERESARELKARLNETMFCGTCV